MMDMKLEKKNFRREIGVLKYIWYVYNTVQPW